MLRKDRLACSSLSASCCFLLTSLLRTQYLDPYDLLYHCDIVGFSVNHLLEILQAFPKILDFPVIEICCIVGALFDEEASADVDQNMCRRGKAPRDVERRCEWDEKWFVGGV